MSKSLEWNPVMPVVPLIIITLVILTVLLIIEWRRRQRFRTARVVCQIVIVTCLLGLFLRPSVKVEAQASSLAILTPGYNPTAVDSLVERVPGLSIIRTPDTEPYDGSVTIDSHRDLTTIDGSTIWVIGSGLPSYSLSEVPFTFNFIPSLQPEGITEISLPSKIVEGVPGVVNGLYQSRSAAGKKLRLVGPGGAQDSTMITQKGTTAFDLRFIAAVPGTLMYKVEEVDSAGNLITTSSLPVFAEEQRKLDILIVSDYPTFELRYLKNFLSDKGYKVSMRNRVSQNRFHQEFANRPSYNLNLLTRQILDATDLLIIDQASHATLSSSERNQIGRSMELGLGVLFLPARATPTSHQFIALSPITGAPDTVRIKLQGASFVLPALPLKPAGDITSITLADQGMIASGCRCTADLKIGFLLLRETYQLGLQGKQAAYREIWTPLLEKVAREHRATASIAIHQPFPVFTDEPTDVSIVSSESNAVATYDSVDVPLLEDVYLDGLWHTRIWADGNRWHTIQADSTQLHFYDLPASEWKALRIANQLKGNAIRSGGPHRDGFSSRRKYLSVPLFIIFILASGFLWLAPKI